MPDLHPERVVNSRWTRESLAERLAGAPPLHDARDLHVIRIPDGARVTEAAVMVPIVYREPGLHVLLTQRTAHLSDHAGQISFPGGRVEPEDRDREETALREMEEEVGLPRSRVTVLGRLPGYEIPSGFRITPIVGWIEPPFDLKPDPFEVESVFEAPLSHFLDPDRYLRREYHFRGRHRHYLAIPYEGRYIWGATAAMLHNFARMLRA